MAGIARGLPGKRSGPGGKDLAGNKGNKYLPKNHLGKKLKLGQSIPLNLKNMI